MKMMLQVWAIFLVAIRRLFSQKGLNLATLIGLVAAIGLSLSIPLYADAVYYRIFRQELNNLTTADGYDTGRSPFAFMFRYVGSWKGAVSWEKVRPADEYISKMGAAVLGLPELVFVRYAKTDNFRLFPKEDLAYADVKEPLAWVNFGFISGIEDHITLLEGQFPAVADKSVDSMVDVLVSEPLATKLGLQVGETYMTFIRRKIENVEETTQIPIRIAGIWQAKDPTDSFWFYKPDVLTEGLLVPQETFLERIEPYMKNAVYLVVWYLVLDGSNVHAADALPLYSRIVTIQQRVSALLPGMGLDLSPQQALQNYYHASSLLTLLLYIFSIPILVLILTFVNLIIDLAVSRKHNEIAVLRSRGATVAQVMGMALVEGLLLGALALAISLPLGEAIAQLMGHTRSFLDFSAPTDLRIGITQSTLYAGLIAVIVAVVAQVLPTIGAARHTIVTYKQERARSLRPPWWQRAWLDVLLLIPAVYGTYILQKQGSVVMPGSEAGVVNNDPFQNPLLFLVPSLGIFAFTLLFVRILPLLMSI